MANVNTYTLDHCERTLFFRVNKLNVPVQLPFQLVTVDSDLQYYEPISELVTDTGQFLAGAVTGAVYLNSNIPLPTDTTAVWEYHGI